MINKKLRLFLLVFSLLCADFGHAQTTNETEELKTVLQSLEKKFNITFSYLNESIEGIRVRIWVDPYELKDYLKYIEKQTNLRIDRLDDRYYAIVAIELKESGICGYIINHNSGVPLGQVSISDGKHHTVSAEDGFFELKARQLGERVVLRHVGFETTTISIAHFNQDTCRVIRMKERLSALDEVIVHNYIAKGIEKKINGAYAISSEQLQVLPGIFDQDVMQSLQVLPGVYSANESVSDINIRGGTGDQNLTLWDGIRMYQTGHFFGLISVFNPYFTSQVNLFKNATTAELGESVSSVIDIEGMSDQAENFSIEGGVNMLNVDLETKIPIGDKTSLYIGGRRSFSGLLQSPTYDQYYERAFGDIYSTNYTSLDTLMGEVKRFGYHDIGMKVIHEPNTSAKWEVSALNIEDELSFEENLINSGEATKFSQVAQMSNGVSLAYQKKWGDKWSTRADGYYSYYRLQAGNDDVVNNQYLEQENEVRDWQAKIMGTYKLSEKLSWHNGYSFNERGITNIDRLNRPAFNRKIKEVMRNHALSSEALYHADANKTVASLGVRVNYFESLDEYTVEPRLLINHKLAEKWALELAGEVKSQTSLQVIDLQNDFLGVEKRRWIQSNNEDLPVLKSKQVSAAVIFADTEGWQLSLESYLKQVSGIVTSSQSFQNQFEFIRSTGEYQVTGADVLLSYRTDQISAWTSYTISRNMNKFRELLSEEFPGNVDIRHFITAGISYSTHKVECSLGFNWHTGNPYTKPDDDQPISDGNINYQFPNSSNLPYYLRVDIAAKYKFSIGKRLRSQIGFSIWNITDRSNAVNAYYQIDESKNISEVIENGLGFTPNVMLRIRY